MYLFVTINPPALCVCFDVHVMFGGRLRIVSMRSLAGDTAQPTVVAISCTSSWTSKVNSIHYAIPMHIPLNGLLPHAPSCDYARLDLMSTGAWQEATSIRGLKADVREAWKRRRKKTSARWPESPAIPHRSLRPASPEVSAHPEASIDMLSRSCSGVYTGVYGHAGVSALRHPKSPPEDGPACLERTLGPCIPYLELY